MPSTLSVLIVDDDPLNRRVMQGMIGRLVGKHLIDHSTIDLTLADGGAAALELLATRRFDGVLLDLMMPEVDGFQVMATLRERGDPTPVVVITAADRSLQAMVPAAHACAVLTKPLDADQMMRAIAAISGPSPVEAATTT